MSYQGRGTRQLWLEENAERVTGDAGEISKLRKERDEARRLAEEWRESYYDAINFPYHGGRIKLPWEVEK